MRLAWFIQWFWREQWLTDYSNDSKADYGDFPIILTRCSVIAAFWSEVDRNCSQTASNAPNMVPTWSQMVPNAPKMVPKWSKWSPNALQIVPKWSRNGVKIGPWSVLRLQPHLGIDFGRVWGSILAPQRTSKINKNLLFQRIDGKPKFEAFFSYFLLWFFIDFQHLFKTVFVLTIRVDWKGGCSESPNFYNGFSIFFLSDELRKSSKIYTKRC